MAAEPRAVSKEANGFQEAALEAAISVECTAASEVIAVSPAILDMEGTVSVVMALVHMTVTEVIIINDDGLDLDRRRLDNAAQCVQETESRDAEAQGTLQTPRIGAIGLQKCERGSKRIRGALNSP
jgi:hypothetical protein